MAHTRRDQAASTPVAIDIPRSVTGDVLVRVTRARLRTVVSAWNYFVVRRNCTPDALLAGTLAALPAVSEPAHVEANSIIRSMVTTWPYEVLRVAGSDAGKPIARYGDRRDGYSGKFRERDHMADSAHEPLSDVVCGQEYGPHPAIRAITPDPGTYSEGYAAGYAAGVLAGMKMQRASFREVSRPEKYVPSDGIGGGAARYAE